jgi:Predicted membrane protein (DUF2142)
MSRRTTSRPPAKRETAKGGMRKEGAAKDGMAKRAAAPRKAAEQGAGRQGTARPRTAQRPTAGSRALPRKTPRSRRRQGISTDMRLSTRARDTLRRVPTTAWVCALIACLNAASWSVITPPFQVPDEPSHFAYVQRLAETASLPTGGGESFPSAEQAALNDLGNGGVRERPASGTIATEAAQRKLEHDLALPYSRKGSGEAGVAASEPPLYYALETIPYGLASGGTILDRLELMRLLSALMGGLTALFVFLFLREALPGAPWAWTVGGLGVALTPLLGMMSGAVNPDALLFPISAALFYCLARGFRRGITPPLAIAIGALLAAGFMTKLNFLGLLPGAVLGLLALCIRKASTSRRTAYRCLGLALAVAASPMLLYIAINLLTGRPSIGTVSAAIAINGKRGSILKELSYIWQFYLPRLPGMRSYFRGFPTTRVYWFEGLVGLYGWLDTTFPRWVYNAAVVPAVLIAVLFARALFTCRNALRNRLLEVLVYFAMSLGVLLIIGADDYLHRIPGEYAEPRYLLPMLALWGAVLALAARGAGRRWGPVAGALIVTLMLAHNMFSELLVISRYYG